MTYNITKTNGTIVKELGENIIDFDTISSIGLIGKLSPNYGETQSNNFIHLAENFANATAPENPLIGMVYFNTVDKSLYMCTDEIQKSWTKLVSMKFEQPKNPKTGDMYYDKEHKQLYVYDDTIKPIGQWVLIGPDNYLNKKKYSTVLTTSSNMSESNYEISFEKNTSNLVIIKIVANEKISEKSNNYGRKEPETSAWIYKMLINSYLTLDGDAVKLVGAPSYELVGQSDDAKKWIVNPQIKDNRLLITTNGLTNDKLSSIKWEIDVEILKV